MHVLVDCSTRLYVAQLELDHSRPAFVLCSDAAGLVTGQILYLDGGITATQ
jgi:hypothetical protein